MNKKTLILDLDETLIYAPYEKLGKDEDAICSFSNGQKYYVYKRPGLDKFLDYCTKNFNIGVWTSAGEEHAKNICNLLFKTSPDKIWTSDQCNRVTLHEADLDGETIKYFRYRKTISYWLDPKETSNYLMEIVPKQGLAGNNGIKNLNKWAKHFNTPLKDIIMIDDSPHKLINNTGNYFYIKSYRGEEDDTELTRITNLLEHIKNEKNICALKKELIPKDLLRP